MTIVQRSWLLDVADITPGEIVELAKAHPKACFIMLKGLDYAERRIT